MPNGLGFPGIRRSWTGSRLSSSRPSSRATSTSSGIGCHQGATFLRWGRDMPACTRRLVRWRLSNSEVRRWKRLLRTLASSRVCLAICQYPARKPVLTQQRSFEAFWHNQVPCRRDADGHGAERISAELRDAASSAGLCRTTAIQRRRRLFNRMSHSGDMQPLPVPGMPSERSPATRTMKRQTAVIERDDEAL